MTPPSTTFGMIAIAAALARRAAAAYAHPGRVGAACLGGCSSALDILATARLARRAAPARIATEVRVKPAYRKIRSASGLKTAQPSTGAIARLSDRSGAS